MSALREAPVAQAFVPVNTADRPSAGEQAGLSVPQLARWILPSVGAVVFAVALVHVLFLSEGTRTLFRDSDAGWHIRIGEQILRTGNIPRVDPFSWTHAGRPWFAWEWLSDIALGGAHALAGPAGVALLAALLIALAAWGSARLASSLGANIFFVAAGTVLLMGATSIHWLARPHIFSWLLALAFVAIAEKERNSQPPRDGATTALWLAPLLACLWANMHGSFPLGVGILVLYAIGERSRRLGTAALASLCATFLNPFTWHLHSHVFGYLRNTYLMDHISEFRSFNFHAPGSIYVELFLLAAVAGMFAMVRQRAYGPALLSAAMLHMSLYSARHLPTAAIVLLPLSAAALTREAERLPRWKSFLDYSTRLRAIDLRVLGVVPVVLVLLATVLGVRVLDRAGRVGFDPARFPVRAAAYLEQRGLEHRVFAKDQWGGYLIYRFAGAAKVFIDGRSDFYGVDHLERYGQVVEVKPGWEDVLQQERVRFVLVPPEHVLASALRLTGRWKPAYADSVAVLFERAVE